MSLEIALMVEGQEGLTGDRWRRLAEAAEGGGFHGLFRSDHLTGASFLYGLAEDIRRDLAEWERLGISRVMLQMLDMTDLEAIAVVARDVVPAFR